MKKIIFILFLFPMSVFSQEKATLYTRYGTISTGFILSMENNSLQFESIGEEGYSETYEVLFLTIYLLITDNDKILIHNPELKEEFESHGTKSPIDSMASTLADKTLIDNYSQILPDIKVVRAFNPDGEVGTAFIDLGAIQQLGDDPKTRNIFALVVVPLSKKATLIGGFQRASTSFGNESFGVNAVTLKIRLYIGN